MTIKIYPKALVCGMLIGVSLVAFEPKASFKPPKEVQLVDMTHLPCGFDAESYEPAETVNGIRFPMVCGCSEIKGTCFSHKEMKYTLPDSYFKEEN